MPRPLVPHRRERILDAAEALVLDRGFDAMSVAAVAERAGIAKGAVYREFESKHDVLDAVLRRGTERINARAAELVGDSPRLSDAYRCAVQVLLDDPLMTAAFLDDRSVLGSHAHAVTDGRFRDRHLAVVTWLRDLQQRGSLVRDVAVEDLALVLSSTTIGLLSASRLLGPLTSVQLEGAVATLARIVAELEPDT
ncbi:TetR/AcrR family transcriptional regulator [Dactylosporangium sp. CA-233914]|uniref:TetR/AcrR family transcriptional regulator n=1 Tax=Dactylosporangium sp. CA-233914 TaxID=3239934 RepID=UPI003D8D7822